MLPPIQQKNKDYRTIFGSFKRTKNIPLDCDYIISSLLNIDDEIPLKTRYNGQIFFSISENKLYHFTNQDSNGFIVDYVCLDDETVYSINVSDENYINVVSNLDDMFSDNNDKTGLRCYIKPLNIMVVNDGTNWVYSGGDYKISTTSVWNTIPTTIKSSQKVVVVNGTDFYNVGNDLILEQKYVESNSLPEVLREGVYYKVDNYLYRVTGGYPYKIAAVSRKDSSDPVVSTEQYVVVTNIFVSNEYINPLSNTRNNIINHQMDTINLNVLLLHDGDAKVCCFPEYEIIDRNNISIKSMANLVNCKIILTKIYEDVQQS